jgi:mono/diheme cytochrome c family protein
MKRVLKWIGFALAGLAGVIVLAAVVMFSVATAKLNRTYQVDIAAVTPRNDAAALERGEHVVRALAGCTGCHGEDLGGLLLLDETGIMTLYGPNLTAGAGGAAATFSGEDWVRAIRHGVGTDGKPLVLMPSQNFRALSDQDLSAVLAYLMSLPPVDNDLPEPSLGPMGYVLALSEAGMVPAAMFDHSEPPVASIEPGVTVEYGRYLVAIGTCRDCHGENLNGRPLPPVLDEPPARNLTPGGQLVGWTEEDFIRTIRTGTTPAGDVLREPMAGMLKVLQLQTDDELRSIFLYLRSLPALEAGY